MESIWRTLDGDARFGPLAEDVDCDVCVIGAGIAGLTTACLLTREGLKVAVLEAGALLSGETGRSSAHLTCVLDGGFRRLEKLHGEGSARLAAESHRTAIDFVEKLSAEARIDCGFARAEGCLFAAPGTDPAALEAEWAAAHRAGVTVTWAPRGPWRSFDTGRCLIFAGQAQIDPARYGLGLALDVLGRGGRVFTGTRAVSIDGGALARVVVENGRAVRARHVVVATHVPFNDRVILHDKQVPYRSHVIAARMPDGAPPAALGWDTAEPYHYVRGVLEERGEGDLLLVGGEDHKTGREDVRPPFEALEAWARERFPEMGEVVRRWSGQILETVDGLAYIGRNPLDAPNVYVATGFSGNGLTYGSIAGMLIADQIQGRENRWEKLYDPRRRTARAAAAFLEENLGVLPQYLDWLTPGGVKAVAEIAPGSGALVREGLRKAAVYRDARGRLSACSAVCPHLGGVVRWNADESTWDCPCHGSRFSPEGRVLNGPANSSLSPLDAPSDPPVVEPEERLLGRSNGLHKKK